MYGRYMILSPALSPLIALLQALRVIHRFDMEAFDK